MGFVSRMRKRFLRSFNGTRVFALVGSSGSGKSYSVDMLVRRYCIDLVIDDGLLIKGGHVLAGVSAKQESSEMMAVKRAIFFHNKHRSAVIRQLDMQFAPRILVLGTSRKMIGRICENLFLPEPCKFIRIEDVRTREEIEYSHRMRDTQGKHIIPIPYMELRKYISGSEGKALIDEAFLSTKTLVSPKFSRTLTGAYSDSEIELILTGMMRKIESRTDVVRIVRRKKDDQTRLDVWIRNRMDSAAAYDTQKVKEHLNRMCAERFEDTRIESVTVVDSRSIENLRQGLKGGSVPVRAENGESRTSEWNS